MKVSTDSELNRQRATTLVAEAASNGAQVIALPECWNCPYSNGAFPKYAETCPEVPRAHDDDAGTRSADAVGESSLLLAALAKRHGVYLIGGSVPERATDSRIYNTCLMYGPDGVLLAKHRKMHLFDIDVPGKMTFRESDTLSAGNQITAVQTKYGKFGIGICYDLRFPEYAQLLAIDYGCEFLCYPGAFNTTTGPAHWELLLRGRAVDNQLYVAAVSPARDPDSSYQAWGHSTVVDPWGVVVSTTEHEEAIVYADVDLKRVHEVRQQIPVRTQKRHDIYSSPAPAK